MGSRWEMERKKDPYYRRAKSEDYRSRASYKLKQLNKRFKIIKEGKLRRNRSFLVYSLDNNLTYNKYGISVSKKLGNAVFRNKYKRKIRSIIDNLKKDYIIGKNYIIITRKGALDKNYQELNNDLSNLI